MEYYSRKTKELYKTPEECEAAEAKYDAKLKEEEDRKTKLTEERKVRAAEVEKAYAEVVDAQKAYHKLLNEFIKDYGSFHMTFGNRSRLDDLFDAVDLFRFF